jgi:Xaa-Pro aminopeptidase
VGRLHFIYIRGHFQVNSFIPKEESVSRIKKLQKLMVLSDIDAMFVFDGVEHLYYGSTIQNGLLVIPSAGEPYYFVRRNVDRAKAESSLVNIHPYVSYKDVVAVLNDPNIVYKNIGIDESTVTVSNSKMLQKTFSGSQFVDAGILLKKNRAVKSQYELNKMRQAGKNGSEVLQGIVELFKEGITEWELSLELFKRTSIAGQNCVARLAPGSGEFFLGNVCFGDHSIIPTAFDGPGGLAGRSAVCPYGGSMRKLNKGDLIFIDIGYPFEEYYVDKTRVFAFGEKPSDVVLAAHKLCLDVQEFVRKRLRPGEIPSKIYEDVYEQIITPSGLSKNFMGYGSNQVKFIGHGIGMVINEYPVIARKFDDPLEEGMVLALEPKKGISGIGLVGTENTFIVTRSGGECITPDTDEIRIVQ